MFWSTACTCARGYHINNFVYKFKIVCVKVHFYVVDTRSSTLFLSSTSYIPGDLIKERLLHVANIWPSGVVFSYILFEHFLHIIFLAQVTSLNQDVPSLSIYLDNHARQDTCFDEYRVSTASWITSLAIC